MASYRKELILPLAAVRVGHRNHVGGKAAALARLQRRGIAIPDGLCVTTLAYQKFLDATGLQADILLEGDRLAAMGTLEGAQADIVVDAAGLVAAPGFIDIHSHSDYTLPINPRAESKIRQGVTTEVIGMCGASSRS